MKIGDKVKITEDAKACVPIEDDIVYTIVDILDERVGPCPIVLNAEQFGKDWVQFFNKNEIIEL